LPSVTVRLVPEGEERSVEVGEGGVRVRDLVKMLGLNPEAVVVLRDGAPLVDSDTVKPGERVDVVRVLSGGLKGLG